MPVPKNRVSRARKRNRSANKRIVMNQFTACLTCQSPIAAHAACKICGHYKGVQVLRSREERTRERGAQRQMRAQAQQAGPVDTDAQS